MSDNQRPLWIQIAALPGWILLCFAAAAIGGLGSMSAPVLYGQLVQPEWAPPVWVFGRVWTVLYILMGVAAWLVWRKGPTPAVRSALMLFFVQLGFNALWSWMFFAWRLGGGAFAEIVLLWLLIALTQRVFWRIQPVAGLLFVPYLVWVSIAAALNWSLWQANPGILG